VGSQVERVPRGSRVVSERVAGNERFGGWLCSQREMRGISIWFVAARTKIPPERIRAIEDGEMPLARDGHGRATARALARAIGADPEEAAARVRRGRARALRRSRPPRHERLFRVFRSVMIVVVLGAGVWFLGYWLDAIDVAADSKPLVDRPDYVDRVLGGDASRSASN